MKKSKIKKIFSIDGGGMGGYFGLYIVCKLKQEYNINVLDEFDLFAGTSVGFIVVFLILNDSDLDKYLKVFEQNKIFSEEYKARERLDKPFVPKYKNEILLDLFKQEHITNISLSDFANRLNNKYFLGFAANWTDFKVQEFSPFVNDVNSWTVGEALLASAAAPSILPALEKNGKLYIDGAITGANNPSEMAVIRALNSGTKINRIKLMHFSSSGVYSSRENINNKIKNVSSTASLFTDMIVIGTELMNQFNKAALKENNYINLKVDYKLPNNKNVTTNLTPGYIKATKDYWEQNKEDIVKFIKSM